MAWVSKGQRVATAIAERAAERGETNVLEAQTTDTLRRARNRLVTLSQMNAEQYGPGLARIDAVLRERCHVPPQEGPHHLA